jgi:hypothetical protein
LHREAERLAVERLLDIQRLEVLEERGSVIPTHVTGTLGDVVTEASRNRNRGYRRETQRLRKSQVVTNDVVETLT